MPTPTGVSPCIVTGCTRKARGNIWAANRTCRYCSHHRMRARRWLDPTQPVIHTVRVRGVAREIEKVVRRDKTGKIEAVATQLYQNLRGYLEGVAQDREQYEARVTQVGGRHLAGRKVFPGWTARAAYELLRSINTTTPLAAACYAGALFLVRYQEPRLFVSEEGWLGAFARTFRKLCGPIAVGFYWNERRGRKEQHYHELPVRVTRQLAELLVVTYTPFASRVIALEQKKQKLPRVIREYLDDAFAIIDGTKTKKIKKRKRYTT